MGVKIFFIIPNMKKTLFFVCVLYINIFYSQNTEIDSLRQAIDSSYNKAMELRFQDQEKAIDLFTLCFENNLKLKDTLNATNCLLKKAEVYENKAQYAQAYDAIWKALILCDQSKNDNIKSVIYQKLGRVYSYYKREDQSIKFLKKALNLQKELEKNGKINKEDLVPYYYAIAATNRELKHKELGKVYLDSAYLSYSQTKQTIPLAYLEFEKANLLFQNNEVQKAIDIMEQIRPWFKENQPSYLVLFDKYLGDMYFKKGDTNKSEELYQKSLNTSQEYKSHIDFTPLVYESLANLYLNRGDYKNAFININNAKKLDAKFFDARSSNNRTLLEIKDNYRIEKERQEKLIQAQHLKQLEQADKIKKLQLIILLSSIIFLVIIGFNFIRNLRAKHKAEKELINRKNELEIHKAQELLQLKNKELAVSALQLIEKDEFLKNIKTIVRGKDDKLKIHEINKILRTISITNNQNWEEFKIRFIDVNKEFYDKMFEKFPNLSQTDQKICALVKLNFSSKEMSRLLGISVESVHTSRHRIRKKLDLSRDVNLEDFINSL